MKRKRHYILKLSCSDQAFNSSCTLRYNVCNTWSKMSVTQQNGFIFSSSWYFHIKSMAMIVGHGTWGMIMWTSHLTYRNNTEYTAKNAINWEWSEGIPWLEFGKKWSPQSLGCAKVCFTVILTSSFIKIPPKNVICNIWKKIPVYTNVFIFQ